jgi:hypothetical protein
VPQSDQCISCARFEGFGKCEAFPEGIPNEIMSGEFDHRQEHEGDHGLRWIPLVDTVSASAATTEGEMSTIEETTGTRWRSVLVLEGVETDDGRLIDPGALDWRDLPLSLMAMTDTGPGGHEGASVAGRIDDIARNVKTNEVIGEGIFDSGDFGLEIERLVRDEMLTGVSVDLAIREFELRGEDGQVLGEDALFDDDGKVVFAVTDASIMGATVCAFPAFADASIELLASGEGIPFDRARVTAPFALRAVDGPLVEPSNPVEELFRDALAGLERVVDTFREGLARLERK